MEIYSKALEFARSQIRNSDRTERHHFRDRFTYTLRVIEWAKRIHDVEGGDIEVIQLAAALHDIGWDEHINHAIISMRIAENFFEGEAIDECKRKKVLEAIEYHNAREYQGSLYKESYIVMDADLLDEVGALSVMWDSMAAALQDGASYYKAYDRIKEYTKKLKERTVWLKTDTGIKFYNDRIRVVDNYINELEYELSIDSSCGQEILGFI